MLLETKKAGIEVIRYFQLPFLKIGVHSLLTVRNSISQPYSLIVSMQALECEVNVTGTTSERSYVK